MAQLLFGGLLATILLGLYIWSIVVAVQTAEAGKPFTTAMSFLLNSIGALISATVVAALGTTRSGDFPARARFEKNLTGIVSTIAKYMPSAYILVWMICGVVIVVKGFSLETDTTVTPLSAPAKAWLGTAIVAVYAYFGIAPPTSGGKNNDDDGNP